MIVVLLTAVGSGISYSGPTSATIGTVKEIKGGVLERQDREVWNPLAVNAEIRANDRVRTGPGATAALALNGVGAILIGPGTEYYLGDPSRGFKSLLKRGYLWISSNLKPGGALSVATTSAVAAVHGTKFSVIQDAEGMTICTCKGSVQVMLKDGKSVDVRRGMLGGIDAAGNMGAPEKGKQRLEKIWKERPARYAPCQTCHRKGKKTIDMN